MIADIEFYALFFLDHLVGRKGEGWLAQRRERNHATLEARLPREPVVPMPVQEVRSLTRKELIERCFKSPAPLVIRQGAKDWPCIRDWNLDFFAQRYADTPLVSFEDGRDTTIKALCQSIRERTGSTMKFHPLIDNEKALQDDANWTWMKSMEIGPALGHVSNLFMTAEGATKLHAANVCNFFVQVTGRKTWRIYPPAVTKWIRPEAKAYHWVSELVPPPWSPDSPLGRVEHYIVELQPGDVLYNPPYFWHYVYTEEPSIALAYKWINFFHCFKVSKFLTVAPLFCKHSSIRGLFARHTSHHDHVRLINLFSRWRTGRRPIAATAQTE